MAKSNRDRVGEVLDLLKSGLGPYVLAQYKQVYKGKYLQEIELFLYQPGTVSLRLPDEATALKRVDTQAWLKLMFNRWNDVFKDKLGHSERSYVSILMETRNQWAHQAAFTNDDAQHAADIAKRLLQAIGARKEADIAAAHAVELQRILLERDADKSVRRQEQVATAMDAFVRRTPVGLKPWRQVVQPHADVRKGQYTLSEFSADLAQVVQGKATPEYGDAQEFFKRTFLTRGLQDLIVNCFLRLNGEGADPVVQLQTNFGGGKTHSLLALYHLAGGLKLRAIPGAEDIVGRIGDIDDFIKCQRAVIVGTDFDGTKPRDHKECTTHNLWGEIAYQLGGLPAYELVRGADESGVSPGSSTLLALLEQHGPALIIVDELVAHARNLYNAKGGRYAANFDSIMTFVQALTEAVRRASDALLLISLPVSELEAGGPGGKEAMDFIGKTLGRLESVWKPVDSDESYEIVRRRLFSDEIDRPARDAVARAFSKMYRDSPGEFPRDVGETAYLTRLEQAYPIHPELFDRLYKDWSTLEGFQQTRGVLRLMATVIHRLWDSADPSLLIMPGSVPLWDGKVRHEILRYLPGNWPAIIDQDIDGDRSKPRQQERENNRFHELMASRRVTRTVFIGSAPSDRTKQNRGLTEEQVHLGTAQPGEQPAVFNDALRRLSDQLTYLYRNETRYWYDTRPTLNRTAEEYAKNMDAYLVLEEAGDRLRAQSWDEKELGGVHFLPESSAEVPDEQRFRVVVLGPKYTHKSGNDESEAMQFIKTGKLHENGERDNESLLFTRGNSQRHHKNMLVFIAPDDTRCGEWQQSIRKYLAWKTIKRKTAELNLDVAQIKQVEENLEKAAEAVDSQLQAAYSWIIVPKQPNPREDIVYDQERLQGSTPFLERAARKLKSNEWLIPNMSPDYLIRELEPLDIWKDTPHLSVKKLWEWLTNYCYLPRLYDREVLEEAIKQGVNRFGADFGYASRVNEDGSYAGLKWQKPATVHFDDLAVIVQPDAAQAQLDALRIVEPLAPSTTGPPVAGPGIPIPAGGGGGGGDSLSTPKPKTRYYGTKRIDATDAKRDLNQIADEIVRQLASLPGAISDISIDITGYYAAGFDDATVRTISENSRTLGLDEFGFEDE